MDGFKILYLHACACVRMYRCVYVCVCVYVHKCYACVRMNTCVYVCVCVYVHERYILTNPPIPSSPCKYLAILCPDFVVHRLRELANPSPPPCNDLI